MLNFWASKPRVGGARASGPPPGSAPGPKTKLRNILIDNHCKTMCGPVGTEERTLNLVNLILVQTMGRYEYW